MNTWDRYAEYWNDRAQSQHGIEAVTGLGNTYNEVNRGVLKQVAPAQVNTVIDIGCGLGLALPIVQALWPGVVYFGADVSIEMLKRADQMYPGHTWIALSGPKLPELLDADLIICHSVMTHIYPADVVAYLKTIRDALTENGRASISVHINCPSLWCGNIGRMDYAPAYFEQMLDEAGLKVYTVIEGNQRVYGVGR